MHNVDFSTDFEAPAAVPTVAPSRADLWLATHWISGGVALIPPHHKAAAVRGAIDGMLRNLPPAPAGRRVVFDSRPSSEYR